MTLGVNDYPGYAGQTWDPYLYAARQCASFANWRCMHDYGMATTKNPNGPNDGGVFADTLHTYYGVPEDGTPRVGDIMSIPAFQQTTGKYGHVAVVLGVNTNGTVNVEDYNWYGTGQYLKHTLSIAGCKFAHVKQGGVVSTMDASVARAVVRMAWWGIGRGEPSSDGLASYTNAALQSGDLDGVVARLRDSAEGAGFVSRLADSTNNFGALKAQVAALEAKVNALPVNPAPAPAPAPSPTGTATLQNAAGLETAITNAVNALQALLVEVQKSA